MSLNKAINKIQDRKIQLLFGAVAFIGGVTTFLVYLQNKKLNKDKREILALDRELKELQLRRMKKGN